MEQLKKNRRTILDEDLIEKPPNIKMISKEAELTVNKNNTFYYLLIDSLS